MKIKIYKSLAMCTLLLGLAACNDFEEMNTDPYAPVYDPEIIGATPDGIDIYYELTPSALKSLQGTESAIGSVFANLTYEGLYNDYQVTTNLTHDIYAAYFANNVSGFVTNSPTYGYNDGWSKRFLKSISKPDVHIRFVYTWVILDIHSPLIICIILYTILSNASLCILCS